MTLSWHDHARDGGGLADVPLLPGLSPDALGEYGWGCCSGPRQLAFRAHGDYVAGFRSFFWPTGEVRANGGILPLGRYIAATACRLLGQAIEAGPGHPPGVHSPGPANRQFSRDELAVGCLDRAMAAGPVDIRVRSPARGDAMPLVVARAG